MAPWNLRRPVWSVLAVLASLAIVYGCPDGTEPGGFNDPKRCPSAAEQECKSHGWQCGSANLSDSLECGEESCGECTAPLECVEHRCVPAGSTPPPGTSTSSTSSGSSTSSTTSSSGDPPEPACEPTTTGTPTITHVGGPFCHGVHTTVEGQNLDKNTCFTIDGKPAKVVGSGSGYVLVEIPAGAPVGMSEIVAKTKDATAKSTIDVSPGDAPTVTAMDPGAAAPGAEVTLTGTHLDGGASVFMNDGMNHFASVAITGNTATQAKFKIPALPPGDYSVSISIENCGGANAPAKLKIQ